MFDVFPLMYYVLMYSCIMSLKRLTDIPWIYAFTLDNFDLVL